GVTVHGLRLGPAGTRAEAHDRDQEQALDKNEDTERPPEDILVQTEEVCAEIGPRDERRLRKVRAAAARGEEEQNGKQDQRHGVKLDEPPQPVNARVSAACPASQRAFPSAATSRRRPAPPIPSSTRPSATP